MRYIISIQVTPTQNGFPLATLLINVLGAFLIGLLSALSLKFGLDSRLVTLLQTGVLGGFTTFSTFALETVSLIEGDKWPLALLYMVLSLVLSIVAVIISHVLIK